MNGFAVYVASLLEAQSWNSNRDISYLLVFVQIT